MDFFKDKTKDAHMRLEEELKRIEEKIQAIAGQKKRIIEVYTLYHFCLGFGFKKQL